MTIAFIGFTIDFIGKVLIAYSAMRIHGKIHKEMATNKVVFKEIKMSSMLATAGLILIVLGYALQAPSKFNH
jgi:uncharacterized membrane protein